MSAFMAAEFWSYIVGSNGSKGKCSSSVGSRCYLNGVDQPVQWTALISYAFEALFGLLFKTVKLEMALISLW